MKRVWTLLAFVVLTVPVLGQGNSVGTPVDSVNPPGEGGGEEASPTEEVVAVEEKAPAEEAAPAAEAAPAEDAAPAEEQAAPAEGEGVSEVTPAEAPAPKEEPVINIKVAAPQPDEAAEEDEDIAVAKEPTKVQPTATISRPKKGGKGKAKKDDGKAVKTPKVSKDKVVTKKPAAPPEPKAPALPAIPLTPISPRNP